MKLPKCDCLNDCGDDSDVPSGKVDPCEHYKAAAKHKAEKLAEQERLIKNARRYELLRNIKALPASERNGIVVRAYLAPVSNEHLDSLLDEILEKRNGKNS